MSSRAIHVHAVIERDGELRVDNLPCRQGDHVDAVVTIHPEVPAARRAEGRARFLARAKASRFRSAGRYPSREELHDRT